MTRHGVRLRVELVRFSTLDAGAMLQVAAAGAANFPLLIKGPFGQKLTVENTFFCALLQRADGDLRASGSWAPFTLYRSGGGSLRRTGTIPLRCAGGAKSVEEEFMTRGMEPAGKPGLDLLHAVFEFIELAAIVAVEVMMVLFTGNLVPRGVTWDLNRSQPPIFDQCFDVAIDGGNSQAPMVLLRRCQSFFQGKRPISLTKCPADGVFLSCVPAVHQGPEDGERVIVPLTLLYQSQNCILR